MGPPILKPSDIPVALPGERCVRSELRVGDDRMLMTCVSMGNPHAVVFVDDVARFDLKRIGPLVEHHPLFPRRVNFHVATCHARNEATMRTWERGSGMTQACGTGACAVLVAGVLEDRLSRSALLHLPGGDLSIEWPEDAGSVFKTGPAVEVFTGQWPT
jgi:diaminopimelate epimerase